MGGKSGQGKGKREGANMPQGETAADTWARRSAEMRAPGGPLHNAGPSIQDAISGGGLFEMIQGMRQPQVSPQGGPGQAQMIPPSAGPQQGMPGQQPAQFQHQMDAMNNGTPGPQYQPAPQQPRNPLHPMIAAMYGMK
jgi:hypothetical protein